MIDKRGINPMDEMVIQRQGLKNPYQQLLIELKEEYGLSPIEAKALIKKIQEFIESMTSNERNKEQITRTVVVIGEPAGKKLSDCKMVQVHLTMQFWGEDKIARAKGLKHLKS